MLDPRWAWLDREADRGIERFAVQIGAAVRRLEQLWLEQVHVLPLSIEGDADCGVVLVPISTRGAAESSLVRDERGVSFVISGHEPVDRRHLASELLEAACQGERSLASACKEPIAFSAIVIVSGASRSAYVVRDLMGSLPVYWSPLSREYWFSAAHDPRAIEATSGPRQLNKHFFARFIYWRYDYTVGLPETHLEEVFQLQPAHMLKVSEGEHRTVQYWTFEELALNEHQPLEHVKQVTMNLLEQSVASAFSTRAVGSQPFIALSGGLDSGVLAALSQRLGLRPTALTAAYDVEHPLDESSAACRLAGDLGLSWEPVMISADAFLTAWRDAYALQAVPMATSSILGYDLLYGSALQMGASGLVLGSRSDRNFAGHHTHFRYHLADLLVGQDVTFPSELNQWIRLQSTSHFPKSPTEFMDWAIQHIDFESGGIAPRSRTLDYTYANWAVALDLDTQPSNFRYVSSSLLRAHIAHQVWRYEHHSTLARLNWLWSRGLSISDGYASVDLFNWCWGLQGALKISGGVNKVLLREISIELLPDWHLRRVGKTGFDVPFGTWMRFPHYLSFIGDVLSTESVSWIGELVDLPKFLRDLREPDDIKDVSPMFVWQLVNSALFSVSRDRH